MFYLWGNAQRAAGGLNQITIPLQGQSMVQGQFTGYAGGFNSPVVTPGVQNGQWNLAYWVVPIPLPFGEAVIQATEREISLLKARMNDAYAVTRQNIARLLYTNNSANQQMPNSFVDAFDNGTNVQTYGGINRLAAGNSAFQGQYINAGAGNFGTAYNVQNNGFTRKAMSALLTKVTDAAGGEPPTFGVMNPADFATLNNDIIGVEQVRITPGQEFTIDTPIRSSFPNVKYSNIYISEDAAMDFSGFYSLVPLGQIGQQGIVVLGYDFVSAKSSSGAWVYNIGNPAY